MGASPPLLPSLPPLRGTRGRGEGEGERIEIITKMLLVMILMSEN